MLINIIGFNISWFGLVYFGNTFTPIALLIFAVHILILSNVKNELLFIAIVTAIGISVDSFLQYINFFIFSGASHIPFWLMTLWLCFASTICHSLKVLASAKLLQIAVGIIFAPLSYLAGVQLNAVELGQSITLSYAVLGLIWAHLIILFFYLRSKIVIKEVSYV